VSIDIKFISQNIGVLEGYIAAITIAIRLFNKYSTSVRDGGSVPKTLCGKADVSLVNDYLVDYTKDQLIGKEAALIAEKAALINKETALLSTTSLKSGTSIYVKINLMIYYILRRACDVTLLINYCFLLIQMLRS
jgi:hypothetical protein